MFQNVRLRYPLFITIECGDSLWSNAEWSGHIEIALFPPQTGISYWFSYFYTTLSYQIEHLPFLQHLFFNLFFYQRLHFIFFISIFRTSLCSVANDFLFLFFKFEYEFWLFDTALMYDDTRSYRKKIISHFLVVSLLDFHGKKNGKKLD